MSGGIRNIQKSKLEDYKSKMKFVDDTLYRRADARNPQCRDEILFSKNRLSDDPFSKCSYGYFANHNFPNSIWNSEKHAKEHSENLLF